MKSGVVIVRVIIWFLLLNGAFFFLEQPVLALGFTDWSPLLIGWGAVCLLFAVKEVVQRGKTIFANSYWGRLIEQLFPQQGGVHDPEKVVNMSDYKLGGHYKKIAAAGIVMVGLGVSNLIVFPLILSHPMLYSQSYRSLLGTVQESSFSKDIEPINHSQIRIVDEETAVKLAEKIIGEVPALGSEVRLGELVLQKVRDKLYYVAPLEHRGFFQWLNNRALGSKGYVMVSATNPQDVKLVQTINNKEVRIKYQPGGYLFDYLPRYVYFKGFITVGVTDYSFEVDDDLNPYWVATLYRNKVGYGGSDAVGAVLVNAQTGEVKQYGVDDIPAWVDRIQPEDFVYRQIYYWGQYVNGFWNSILATAGTLKPTGSNLHLIYGNDNKVYWYTGITSAGKDESTVGFLLVNSRTKEAKWYKAAGATETAARKSAEGQVQEKGYRAGYPILYNISGIPTYITPLKDKEGLLKLVAFISVENYNIVGVGPDIDNALRSYRQNLANKGNSVLAEQEILPLKVQGKITRVSTVVKGGESYFYFTMEGDSRIFVGTAATSPKLPLMKVGDMIQISFHDGNDSPMGIVQFDAGGY